MVTSTLPSDPRFRAAAIAAAGIGAGLRARKRWLITVQAAAAPLLLAVVVSTALMADAATARVVCPRDNPHVGKRSCPDGAMCYQTGVRWRCKPAPASPAPSPDIVRANAALPAVPPAAKPAAPPVTTQRPSRKSAAARPRRIALPSDDFDRLGLLCSGYDNCKDVPACHFGGDGGRTWRFTETFVASQKKRGFSWAALCLAQNNGIADAHLIIEQQFWPHAWLDLEGDALKARIIADMRKKTRYYVSYFHENTEYKASDAAAMQRLEARLMRLSVDQLMNHYVDTLEIRDPELAKLVAKPDACHRRAIPLLDCPPTQEGARTYGAFTANQINHILLAVLAAEHYGCTMTFGGTAQSARVVCKNAIKPHIPVEPGKPYSIELALSYTGAIEHNPDPLCAEGDSDYCRFARKFLTSLNVDAKAWLKRHAVPRVQVFVDPGHPMGFVYAIDPDDGAAGPGFSATALAQTLDGSRRSQVRLGDIISDLDG